MKSKPVAHVVEEYFQTTMKESASINDILNYYVGKYGESNPIETKKARHAIYLKTHRLVKSGQLIVAPKNGKTAYYALANNFEGSKKKKKTISAGIVPSEKEILLKRLTELEYELELCIAEAQGYEEMKSILPTQLDLLTSKKSESKKRAITLNGLLTSTQTILHALS